MKIIAATTNAGKVREIKKIFQKPNIEVISMKELGIDIEIEENGSTFLENALIKAREIHKLCGYAVVSDDSGLCVDALGGEPGIYSARYAGENATDEERIKKLLGVLENEENRNAKFVSAVAFIAPDGREFVALGEVHGSITREVRGDGGFGYDPIFYSTELLKTFGEATTEEKNSISHRARAFNNLYDLLKKEKLFD